MDERIPIYADHDGKSTLVGSMWMSDDGNTVDFFFADPSAQTPPTKDEIDEALE